MSQRGTGARIGAGRSVRTRILAAILLVTGLGMAAAGGITYAVQRGRTIAAIDLRLAATVTDARFVAGEVTADQIAADGVVLATLTEIVKRLRPGTDETTFGIVDGVATLHPGGTLDFRLDTDRVFVDRVVAEAKFGGVVTGTATRHDRSLRYIAIPITAGSAQGGLFVTAIDVGAELAPVDSAFTTFAVVASIAFVVIALVGWFVAGRLLKPIRLLRDAATRITASNTTERIEVAGRDDVSDLADTVNSMLDRIEEGLAGQRRLLDDVGHELKTPITIVRGHLEVMDPTDSTDVEAVRALAIDELDRMSTLVADIAVLADVQRPVPLDAHPTDIRGLTLDVRRKASALSNNDWKTESSADVTALVDARRITQAMLQLASNAVSHGASDEPICVGSAVDLRTSTLSFWVADRGPGVSDDSRELIFERFRRGAEGRGIGGSGLGLSIVTAIAEAHGGRAFITPEPRGGSRFTIEIPYIEPAPAPDRTPE